MPLLRTLLCGAIAAWGALASIPATGTGRAPAATAAAEQVADAVVQPSDTVPFDKRRLGQKFLLQVSYEHPSGSWQDFMTSRSRIVTFERYANTVRMVEDARDPGASAKPLATIPIDG